MYPTTVIILVEAEAQRSRAVICGISPSNTVKDVGLPAPRAATLGPLSLAVGPADCASGSVPYPPLSRALQSHDVQENWKAGWPTSIVDTIVENSHSGEILRRFIRSEFLSSL